MVLKRQSSAVEENILARLGAASQIAVRMLPRMIVEKGPDAGLFCQKIKENSRGELVQEGASIRYSIIALVGVAAVFGGKVLERQPWSLAVDRLWELLASERLSLGELGLLLWLARYREERLASQVVEALHRQWERDRKHIDAMETAWVVAGIASTGGLPELAFSRRTLEFLLASFNPVTHLFALNAYRRCLPWGTARMRQVLGSFASQVYPIVALSQTLELHSDPRTMEILQQAVRKTCNLQGPRGEWWWIFDTRTGGVWLDYPIYSVHQDGMGPMALLAASRALKTVEYLPHISRSLDYLFHYRDARREERFIDEQKGVIWRALVKDLPGEDPADTPFGLGAADLNRMRAAARPAWLRTDIPRETANHRILKEARPYCPGWILYAYSQACELFDRQTEIEAPIFETSGLKA